MAEAMVQQVEEAANVHTIQWKQEYQLQLDQVASTGSLDGIEWPLLKDIIKHKIDHNIANYQKFPPKPEGKSVSDFDISTLKTHFFKILDTDFPSSPPFTIQRLAELCTISFDPSKPFGHPHHRTLHPYLQAISRTLSITSPISAFPLPPSTPLRSIDTSMDDNPQLIDMISPIPWLKDQIDGDDPIPTRAPFRGRSPSIDKTDPPTHGDLGLGLSIVPLPDSPRRSLGSQERERSPDRKSATSERKAAPLRPADLVGGGFGIKSLMDRFRKADVVVEDESSSINKNEAETVKEGTEKMDVDKKLESKEEAQDSNISSSTS